MPGPTSTWAFRDITANAPVGSEINLTVSFHEGKVQGPSHEAALCQLFERVAMLLRVLSDVVDDGASFGEGEVHGGTIHPKGDGTHVLTDMSPVYVLQG